MAEGIRKINRKKPYEASVYLAAEKRKVRKSFHTLAEARAWRREALRDDLIEQPDTGGGEPEPSGPTLAEYAAEFLAGMESGAVRDRNMDHYKPSTIRSYRRSLVAGVLPELGRYRLAEIRLEDVQGLVKKLMGQGLADSTVRNRLDPLRAIYRLAIEERVVKDNPTLGVKLPRQKNRRSGVSGKGEARKLIAALPRSEQALWACAFYSGLRRGELQALRVRDLDLARNEIHVRRGWDQDAGEITPKSRAGTRTVPILDALRPFLVGHLLDTRRGGDDLVFGRTEAAPFVPSTVGNRARSVWREAGLEPVTLHQARHTFASVLIDAGITNAKAISEVMGHTSVQMTWDQYGHLFTGSRTEIREKADAYLEAQEPALIG